MLSGAVLRYSPAYQQRGLAQGLFIQGTQQPMGDEAEDAALINLNKVQTDVVMSSPAVLKSTFPATSDPAASRFEERIL